MDSRDRRRYQAGFVALVVASCLGLLNADRLQAQGKPVPTPVPSQGLSQESRNSDWARQQLEMQKAVQDEVDRAFNHTTVLLNVLLTALTVLPIIATVLLYLSRQRAIQELREQMEDQIQKEITTQVEAELQQQSLRVQQQMIELQQQSLAVKEQMQQQAGEFQEEIEQLRNEFEVQLKRLKNTATEFEREKTRIFQEITNITLVSTSKDVLSPEKQRQIETLIRQLDELKSKHESLDLTVTDWIRVGDALFFEKRYQEAISSYDRAIQQATNLDTNVFAAWLGKTKSLRGLKQYTPALAANTQAMALKPDDPFIWFERGYILQLQKQFEAALESYDHVIATRPDYHRARNHRGYVLLKLGRYPEALEELNKGIELKPDYGNGYYGRACYYLLHHQIDRALEDLRVAIRCYPRYKTLVATDPDFATLWEDSRFQALIHAGETYVR